MTDDEASIERGLKHLDEQWAHIDRLIPIVLPHIGAAQGDIRDQCAALIGLAPIRT